jgi:acetylornithine deacetylase
MDLFPLTRTLIDIPSVTGEEDEVGRFLSSYLEALGYKVERQRVAGERCNLIATAGGTPRIVLSTHMDTVPAHVASSEDEERIYGRGACDAKGIIAAQIFAAEKLRSEGLNEIGLLFTVDEETGSLGAQIANSHPNANECRYLINGEPTDSKLATGTKGSLRCTITTEGKAAHSAYPEHGESAIDKLLDVLESIRRCQWPADELFGETTCNIGVIAGGPRPNVVAAEASAQLQIRLATEAAFAKQLLQQAVAGRARIEYLSAHEPVHLVGVEGFEECLVRFTTDIPYLSNWGTPLLIGPGSILEAHTDHEHISKTELKQAVELYAQLVRMLAAQSNDRLIDETKSATGC